jgi:hypothetical protein
LSIRSDSGSPTLLALRSTLAGHPQPPAPGCCPAASSWILLKNSSSSPPSLPTLSMLALRARLIACFPARRGARPGSASDDWLLASLTPDTACRGDVAMAEDEGDVGEEDDGEEEHGGGVTTAATWMPMGLGQYRPPPERWLGMARGSRTAGG